MAMSVLGAGPVGRAGWRRALAAGSATLVLFGCGGGGGGGGGEAIAEPPPATTYFDDFGEQRLSAARWLDLETVRLPGGAPPGGTLLLEQAATGRLGATQDVVLQIPNANGHVTSMEVPITVEEVAAEDPNNANARPLVRIVMTLFNDGRPGTGLTGDVLAQIRLQRASDGTLEPLAFLSLCKDATCADAETVGVATGLPGVAVGQPHVLRMAWDGTRVTFGLDSWSQQILPAGVTAAATARAPFAQVNTRVDRMETSDEKGYIRARIGQVRINGEDYSPFLGDMLPEGEWLQHEFERRVVDGKLHSRVAAYSGRAQGNNLRLADPAGVTRIGAEVAVMAAEAEGMEPRARVGGTWYSSRAEGTGSAGDVFAEVGLVRKAATLVGRATVARCLDANCGRSETIVSDEETLGTFEIGQAYAADVRWDGTKFRFAIADRSFEYAPAVDAAPIGPARARFMLLGTRVVAGTDPLMGRIHATFDNVVVERQP